MQWHIRDARALRPPTEDDSQLYGETMGFPDQKVLYRSDTKGPVVSGRYRSSSPASAGVLPGSDEVSGYELETAGVLKSGRKFWATGSHR